MNITSLLRRRELLMALAALPTFAAAQAARVEVRDEVWLDATRQREIPVRLRVPPAPGPWPLVMYSHGLGGSREGGDAWGKAWAAAGIVVLHLQHPGSDANVWRDGPAALRAAANAQQLIDRVADVRFALDEAERRRAAGAQPWASVMPGAIGIAGHSFGARTVQALAGEKFPVPTQLSEPRLRAYIALSPSTNTQVALQEQLAGVQRPFLAVTGSLDGDPFGAFSGGESRAKVFDALPAAHRALLWLAGADHMSFAGNAERRISGAGLLRRQPGALALEPAQHALIARVSTLWWRWHLLGDGAAQAALRQLEGLAPGDRFELG
jgi:predicted dienelactone hydrolase